MPLGLAILHSVRLGRRIRDALMIPVRLETMNKA